MEFLLLSLFVTLFFIQKSYKAVEGQLTERNGGKPGIGLDYGPGQTSALAGLPGFWRQKGRERSLVCLPRVVVGPTDVVFLSLAFESKTNRVTKVTIRKVEIWVMHLESAGSNPARDNHTLIIEYLGAPAGL